jgi:hypothetical protein
MLSNKEFSATNKVSAELTPEMAEFAMFSLDLGDSMVCVGRDKNGKRIMENEFPRLRGKGVELWNVKPVNETRDFGGVQSRNEVAIATRKSEAEIRAENIARYAKIVENADATDLSYRGVIDGEKVTDWSKAHLFGDDTDEVLTENEKFFALDTELVGGKCRRKGGVKNHEGFESLVDG